MWIEVRPAWGWIKDLSKFLPAPEPHPRALWNHQVTESQNNHRFSLREREADRRRLAVYSGRLAMANYAGCVQARTAADKVLGVQT